MESPSGLEPFRDQSVADQIGLAIVGALVCLGAYVGAAVLLYDITVLDHGGPDTPRRVVGVIASVACWGLYSLAFVRGKGGPVTTSVVSPLATLAVVPVGFRWFRFGPPWSAVRDRIAWVFFDVGLFVDVGALVLPGVSLFLSVLTLWASRLDEAAIREWQRRHLPDEFRDAFVAETDLDR